MWLNDEAGVYVVADGMGGHDAGEVAARLSAEIAGALLTTTISQESTPEEDIPQILDRVLEAVNQLVRAVSQAAKQRRPMGCALIGAVWRPPFVHVVHAGDCRAYLARAGRLIPVTEDHSILAELIAAGRATEDELRGDPRRNGLTAVVGQAGPLSGSGTRLSMLPGDWLILCSDGLWGMVDDDEILSSLAQANGAPHTACRRLVDAANLAGGEDNVSVVALRFLAPDAGVDGAEAS